jgi:hypothetical protein
MVDYHYRRQFKTLVPIYVYLHIVPLARQLLVLSVTWDSLDPLVLTI